MDKDTFLEKIKEIGVLENEGDIRVALTELSESVTPIFDEKVNLEEENIKFKEDNEKLREANMKLFLQVGSKTPKEAEKETTGEEEKPPRKFEDLFDNNGELKLK